MFRPYYVLVCKEWKPHLYSYFKLMTNTQNCLKRHSRWVLGDLDGVFLFFPSFAAVQIHICFGTVTSQFRNRSHLKISDSVCSMFCLASRRDLTEAVIMSLGTENFPLAEALSTNGTQQTWLYFRKEGKGFLTGATKRNHPSLSTENVKRKLYCAW